YRGKRVALLAPLVIGRKGYYTELADWAASRGYSTLRVDGAATPTDRWPRLDRFKEHDIELPVAELDVSPAADRDLLSGLKQGPDLGRSMVRVVEIPGPERPARKVAIAVAKMRGGKVRSAPLAADAGDLYSTERACPSCSRSFEPLDPRLFSYNSRYGWC